MDQTDLKALNESGVSRAGMRGDSGRSLVEYASDRTRASCLQRFTRRSRRTAAFRHPFRVADGAGDAEKVELRLDRPQSLRQISLVEGICETSTNGALIMRLLSSLVYRIRPRHATRKRAARAKSDILKLHAQVDKTPFFRRYPQALTSFMDACSVVDIKNGFYYNRIPKAANTTIIQSLYIHATDDRRDMNMADLNQIRRDFWPTLAKLSEIELKKFNTLKHFTVVRRPVNRLASAYLEKIKPIQYGDRRAIVCAAIGKSLDEHVSFDAFLRYIEMCEGIIDNRHWCLQSALIPEHILSNILIGKVENMESDFMRIIPDVLGADIPMVSLRRHRTDSDKLVESFSVDTKKTIKNIYKKDFEAFGYE